MSPNVSPIRLEIGESPELEVSLELRQVNRASAETTSQGSPYHPETHTSSPFLRLRLSGEIIGCNCNTYFITDMIVIYLIGFVGQCRAEVITASHTFLAVTRAIAVIT